MSVRHSNYADRLLLTGIGSLHHRPGSEPLTGAWLLLDRGRVEGLGLGEPPTTDAAVIDLGGAPVIPAPIDSHTHLLFGGDRSEEFASRARGERYEARLAAGGGIHATVRATAATSDEQLIDDALRRIDHLRAIGLATVEVKTGYGLNEAGERRLMDLLDRLRERASLPIMPTLLAHVPPPGTAPEAMVPVFCERLIPEAAERGFGFDVFVEQGAFDCEAAATMLAAAARRGLRLHVHADQLSASGAAGLAARFGAASAEHLEFVDDEDLVAMAEAGVVANLLPGAWLQTGCGPKPPVERMRQAGVAIGVASDWNPGSSYTADVVLAASLGISALGLSCDEALAGITSRAAAAMKMPQLGGLEVGDSAVPWALDLPSVPALFQRLGVERGGQQFHWERRP